MFMEEIMRDLKTLAQQAKNRLKGKTTDERSLKLIHGGEVEYKRVLISDKENQVLYNKIKALLEKEEVFNPIAQLIDFKYYNSLPVNLREKYFFDIVDKFHMYKEQIENESIKLDKAN